MKNFDPIDILFICLISCYLIVFIAILVVLFFKYKNYKRRSIAEDKTKTVKEVIETPISKKKDESVTPEVKPKTTQKKTTKMFLNRK